ncbi:GlxA family transcriptional regulator [Paracoccus rhizosphaerae]|uniref:GlxA family transcriptional regulator n=1 Tax=Paracoccus rhizosphaerae TaxID=1133347 RepID=A0ABV6CKH7_9RHOB|nr:helix-turn-helix domain-containing protein [Paracoccus rhizosphaerae]
MRIAILLFDGFSNMVLSCLLEPLRAVRDQGRSDISWHIITADEGPVRSSSGLLVASDGDTSGSYDLLIVVAGYGYRDHAAAAALRQVSALSRRSALVIGADTGPWLLAALGMLSSKRATLHWSLLSEFAEAFPDVQVEPASHVSEGKVWTCGGASGALNLMLAFITDRYGQANAFIASSMFLHDAARPQARIDSGPRQLTGTGTARLRQVIGMMAETLEDPPSLPQLAGRCGLSLRKLDRLFRTEVGMPPGRYFQMLRLSRAQELANTTGLGLREIALQCGFADAPALSKAFRRAYGCSIRQTRAYARSTKAVKGRGQREIAE